MFKLNNAPVLVQVGFVNMFSGAAVLQKLMCKNEHGETTLTKVVVASGLVIGLVTYGKLAAYGIKKIYKKCKTEGFPFLIKIGLVVAGILGVVQFSKMAFGNDAVADFLLKMEFVVLSPIFIPTSCLYTKAKTGHFPSLEGFFS